MNDDAATFAVMRAGMRAQELRHDEAGLLVEGRAIGSILRGAPSHSAAHLLHALAELGWELRRIGS